MARERVQAVHTAGDNSEVLTWVFDLGHGVLRTHLGPLAGELLVCAAELRRHIALGNKQREPVVPPSRPAMSPELTAAFTLEERRRRTLCAQYADGENSQVRHAWSVLEMLAGCVVDAEPLQFSDSAGMSDPGGDPLPETEVPLISFMLLLLGDETQ